MTVPAQSAVFSLAPQASKVGASGTFTVGSYTWRRYRVPRISGGGQQITQLLPLENGGVIVGTGVYKLGAFFGMEVDLIPRLENTFGYILRGALGAVSSVTGARYTASGFIQDVTGVNAHLFRFNPSDSTDIPWLAVRRTIPGATSSDIMGEVGYDCKINMLRLNFPAAGLMTSRISFLGRQFKQEVAGTVNAWTYSAQFEDSDSVAHSAKGSMTMYDTSPTITGMSLDIANNLTSPQQEMIIGSFYPDDFVPLTRACTIRMVYKWSNPELYRKIMNGGASELNWSEIPFVTEKNGTIRAFEASFGGVETMSGSSPAQSAKLKIFANRVAWQFDANGVELQAGDIVAMPFVGTVLDAGDEDYIQIALENQATSYAWT